MAGLMSRMLAEMVLRNYGRWSPSGRGGYRLVRWLRGLIPRDQWQGVFTTPDGLELDLDLATYPDCCMAFGLYELTTTRLIRQLLRPGEHFVDVGANLGYFTLLASKLVGPTGRVDAIEPHPQTAERLRQNIMRHEWATNIRVHELCALDQACEVKLHSYEPDRLHNHGCATLFAEPGMRTSTVRVPALRLDKLLKGTYPKMIKIDVEGAESLVVTGMEGILHPVEPPIVIAESNPPLAHRAGFSTNDWVRRLLEMQPRYQVHVIDRKVRMIEPTHQKLEKLGQVNLMVR